VCVVISKLVLYISLKKGSSFAYSADKNDGHLDDSLWMARAASTTIIIRANSSSSSKSVQRESNEWVVGVAVTQGVFGILGW